MVHSTKKKKIKYGSGYNEIEINKEDKDKETNSTIIKMPNSISTKSSEDKLKKFINFKFK